MCCVSRCVVWSVGALYGVSRHAGPDDRVGARIEPRRLRVRESACVVCLGARVYVCLGTRVPMIVSVPGLDPGVSGFVSACVACLSVCVVCLVGTRVHVLCDQVHECTCCVSRCILWCLGAFYDV